MPANNASPRVLLCAACERGDVTACSGWCGVVAPPPMYGPPRPGELEELADLIGCTVEELFE